MTGYVRPPDKVRHKTGVAGAKVIVMWESRRRSEEDRGAVDERAVTDHRVEIFLHAPLPSAALYRRAPLRPRVGCHNL